ncbi:HIT domain-containing protein [Myxococcota bacterium]|nr:HIT domain-containing protein [Myxococcota bacterium]
MKNLWAPWRMAYIEGDTPKPDPSVEPCIFCRYPRETSDRDNLVLWRGEHAFVMMNRFPYSNGHLLVVPYAHASKLSMLDAPVRDALFATVSRMTEVLDAALHPEGMNVGMNLGQAAGAGIAAHLHVHVVPRWLGDTNFMPVLAEAKVISEHLFATYDKLASKL